MVKYHKKGKVELPLLFGNGERVNPLYSMNRCLYISWFCVGTKATIKKLFPSVIDSHEWVHFLVFGG